MGRAKKPTAEDAKGARPLTAFFQRVQPAAAGSHGKQNGVEQRPEIAQAPAPAEAATAAAAGAAVSAPAAASAAGLLARQPTRGAGSGQRAAKSIAAPGGAEASASTQHPPRNWTQGLFRQLLLREAAPELPSPAGAGAGTKGAGAADTAGASSREVQQQQQRQQQGQPGEPLGQRHAAPQQWQRPPQLQQGKRQLQRPEAPPLPHPAAPRQPHQQRWQQEPPPQPPLPPPRQQLPLPLPQQHQQQQPRQPPPLNLLPGPALDAEQRAAAYAPVGGQAVEVVAGAGSGKTTMLVERGGFLLQQQGVFPRNLLVLTFTNKMAAEFRERLQRRGLSAGQVTCCTMHAFCMRVLVVWGGWQQLGFTRAPTPLTDAKQTGIILSRCIREAMLDMRLSEVCAWLQLPSTQYTSWQAVADYLRHGGVRQQPTPAGGEGPPRQPSAADLGGSVADAQGALSAPAGAMPGGAVPGGAMPGGAEPPPLPELAELYRQCFEVARREEEKEQAKGSKGKKKAGAGAAAAGAAGAGSKPARKRKAQAGAAAAGAAAAAAAAGSDEAAEPPAKAQQKGLQQRGIYAAFGQAAPQQRRTSQQAARSRDPPSKAASSSRGYGLHNQQQQRQREQQALHLRQAQAPQQQVSQQQQQQQQASQQQHQADAHQLAAMSPTMRLSLCLALYAALRARQVEAARRQLPQLERQLLQDVQRGGPAAEAEQRRLRSKITELEEVVRQGVEYAGEVDPLAKKKQPAKEIKRFKQFISEQKGKGYRPEDFPSYLETQVWARFQRELHRMNLVDFGDMLTLTVELLRRDAQRGCAPASLLGRLRRRYTQILADEFQDSNVPQVQLLLLLVGSRSCLTTVGDPRQSIYGFLNAVPGVFTLTKQYLTEYVGVEVAEHRLCRNYRSYPHTLQFARAVLAGTEEEGAVMQSTKDSAGHRVRVTEYGTPEDEAEGACLYIKERVAGGTAYRDIACLFRCFKMGGSKVYKPLVYALDRHGIPYRLVRAKRVIEVKVVQQLLAYARLSLNPDDDIALLAVAQEWPGIGEKAQQALQLLQESLVMQQDQQQQQQQQQRRPSLLECAARLAAGAGGQLATRQRNAFGAMVSLLLRLRREVYSRGPVEALDWILHFSGLWERHAKSISKAKKRVEKWGGSSSDVGEDGEEAPTHAPGAAGSDSDSDDSEEEGARPAGAAQGEGQQAGHAGSGSGERLVHPQHRWQQQQQQQRGGVQEGGDEASEEEDESDEADQVEGHDPFADYTLHHQYSGAIRVVLREAARFAGAYQPCVEFTQDVEVEDGEGRTVLVPLLVRLCYQQLFASMDDRQVWEQVVQRGSTHNTRSSGGSSHHPQSSGGGGGGSGRHAGSGAGAAAVAAAAAAAAAPDLYSSAADAVLGTVAAAYKRGPQVLRDFLAYISLDPEDASEGAAAGDPLEDGVIISTIHAAKGLEWKAVMGLHWNDGFLPTESRQEDGIQPRRAQALMGAMPVPEQDPDSQHAAEERRLAHVAATWARERLFVSYVRYSWYQGKAVEVPCSSILRPLLVDSAASDRFLRFERMGKGDGEERMAQMAAMAWQ